MTSKADALKLADAVRASGIDLSQNGSGRGWHTMGAVIADAVLQRRNKYHAVVLPRAKAVEELGLETTELVLAAISNNTVWEAFNHKSAGRQRQFRDIANVLDRAGVQTVAELAAKLQEPGSVVASELRGVKNVGDKTINYLPILCGLDGVAVDVHLRRFAADSGAAVNSYEDCRQLYVEAARELGVTPGTLDRAVWRHMSSGAVAG